LIVNSTLIVLSFLRKHPVTEKMLCQLLGNNCIPILRIFTAVIIAYENTISLTSHNFDSYYMVKHNNVLCSIAEDGVVFKVPRYASWLVIARFCARAMSTLLFSRSRFGAAQE